MYVHFMYLFAPWTQDVIERVTRLSEVAQSVLGMFCVRLLVLIADWVLL